MKYKYSRVSEYYKDRSQAPPQRSPQTIHRLHHSPSFRGRRMYQASRGGRRVAIVGAGFGGLTCAAALLLRGPKSRWDVEVFEQAEALDDDREGGEISLEDAPEVLDSLGLRADWDVLRDQSRSPRAYSVPKQAMRRLLAKPLRYGNIHFSTQIIKVINASDARWQCESADGHIWGPFDMVVDASGLLGSITANAAIGDARLARHHWWHRLRHFRYGANDALKDGLELASMLGAEPSSCERLGKFGCWERERRSANKPTSREDIRRLLVGAALAALMAVLATRVS
jgi:threonine dehydrogenase-like Zn-dependent dehydrogenase